MSTNARDIEISELEGFDDVANIVANRPLFHFSAVHRFCFSRRNEDLTGNTWEDVELVMQELNAPHAQIGIMFHQVADVSFSGFGSITGLYFRSIQERGWERLLFEVGDYEESQIHLFCHAISVFDPNKNGMSMM